MIRAYLFALDPTAAQEEAFRSHCGAARVAYNWCLARILANWAQRQAEESYGIPEHERTPWVNTSAYGLRKAWNAAKHEVAPWWAENSKEAYATGCANLATALGNRKAGRAQRPRFKSKRRSRLSCRFTVQPIGLAHDRHHVQLPVIGVVRTCESTRKLARKVEVGTARIRSATHNGGTATRTIHRTVGAGDVVCARVCAVLAAIASRVERRVRARPTNCAISVRAGYAALLLCSSDNGDRLGPVIPIGRQHW